MSSPDEANANANVEEKILQYEKFISDVMRRDLERVLEQRDSVYEKISQYLQLKNTIQSLQDSGSQQLKTDVDLGCNFYVQAEVEDSSRIFVAVGYGFFVEMTHEEALRFIDKKTNQLTAVCGSCRDCQTSQRAEEEKFTRRDGRGEDETSGDRSVLEPVVQSLNPSSSP
ncbi:Protein UXT [Collichthys lucidus]|uniref:Protein UXT n=1 Tax=Collichthys lucidus TaxID=240159 RepID=A0A4U5TV42_COLLU|nr:Protein UXT [Collichthys lucidus]